MATPRAPRVRKPAAPKPVGPVDIDILIGEATLPEKTVSVCVAGSLLADYENAFSELRALIAGAADGNVSAADAAAVEGVRARIEDLQGRIERATVRFRCRSLNKDQWRSAMIAAPKRKGHEVDESLGYNPEAFEQIVVRSGVVEPVLSTEQWDRLEPVLNIHQWGLLVAACECVNRREGASVPFS